jgi:hypothetical protein
MEVVAEHFFGFAPNHKQTPELRVGPFGKSRAYYGVLECQGRGSLHFHGLVWTMGAENLLGDSELAKKLNRIVSASFFGPSWVNGSLMRERKNNVNLMQSYWKC